MNYTRSIDELREHATLWWPESLQSENANSSIIPRLIETQTQFLSLLNLCTKDPFQIFSLLHSAEFPANLFLKHLVVLSDYGGEPMQRLGRSFVDIFPDVNGNFYMDFVWQNSMYTYNFEELPIKALGNKKLGIDGEGLSYDKPLSSLMKDMIAILLFASTSDMSDQAGLSSCEIGSLLGDEDALETFVKQRYIVVSRITGGAKANNLGQLAQSFVISTLKTMLGSDYSIKSNGTIRLDGYSKPGGMPFDIVVTKGTRKIGIEVSFQVTTNSTIERKSGQAADRMNLMHKNGYKIAYVLDGAGNFQRSSAISTICSNSDCTVAYTEEEFKILSEWILSELG